VQRRGRRNFAPITLADRQITALIAGMYLAIQAQFDAQALTAHPRLHFRARDAVALSGEGERVVVGDHALFNVTQNGGQFQVWRQGAMLIGKAGDRPCEIRIPFGPIFFL